eukprot:2654406-Pyramimonas_sp.AAC.1
MRISCALNLACIAESSWATRGRTTFEMVRGSSVRTMLAMDSAEARDISAIMSNLKRSSTSDMPGISFANVAALPGVAPEDEVSPGTCGGGASWRSAAARR